MEQKLTTTRLRLRPIRRGDTPRVQALCSNWNVARMLSRVPYPNPVDLEAMAKDPAKPASASNALAFSGSYG